MRVYLTKAEIALVKRWARENTEMDKLKEHIKNNGLSFEDANEYIQKKEGVDYFRASSILKFIGAITPVPGGKRQYSPSPCIPKDLGCKFKGVVSDNKRVCLNPADRMETLERRIWNAETKEEEQRLESEMYGIESQMLGKGEPDGW